MTPVYFTLIVGFILGLLVGFLIRSEARHVEAGFGGREEVGD